MSQPSSARAVLVSGASSGIGLALVKRLRKKNYRVIATARESSLGRFADAGIVEDERTRIRALDVTDYQQQCDVVDEICAEWGCIDVLVNNAAISVSAVIEDMTSADDHEQFETNYFGPLRLIRLVLPRMHCAHHRKHHEPAQSQVARACYRRCVDVLLPAPRPAAPPVPLGVVPRATEH